MDTRDPAAGGEQRRSVTTEDLVDWAHRHQRPEEGRPEEGRPVEERPVERRTAEGAGAQRQESAAAEDTRRPAAAPATDRPEPAPEPPPDEQRTPLFKAEQVQEYRSRWNQLQVAFVDEPRRAVQQADELVAEVIQTLAATFAEHKRQLESQWRREGEADTEELRLALRRYRAFFDQLLRG